MIGVVSSVHEVHTVDESIHVLSLISMKKALAALTAHMALYIVPLMRFSLWVKKLAK